eukprot:scaffold27558_cov73-Skeletonema_marinoi.AAC.1
MKVACIAVIILIEWCAPVPPSFSSCLQMRHHPRHLRPPLSLHPHQQEIRPRLLNTQALQPALQQVLHTAGITDTSSPVQFDIEYQPSHTLGDSNLPPSQFAICGADITIDHCPDPPSASAL